VARVAASYSKELVYLFREYVTDGSLATLLALFASGDSAGFLFRSVAAALVNATKNPTD